MKRNLCLTALMAGFFLTACLSKNEQQLESDIPGIFGAQSCDITHGKNFGGSNGGTYRSIQLKGTKNVDMDPEVRHAIAYYYYKHESPLDGAYQAIEVVQSNNSSQSSTTFKMPELQSLDSIMTNEVNHFFEAYNKKALDEVLDDRVPDSSRAQIPTLYHFTDSIFGNIKNGYTLVAVSNTSDQETNESFTKLWIRVTCDKAPAIIVLTLSLRSHKYINLKFRPVSGT